MGLSIYHVGFVRSANYFFQRLQGFTPAGFAASRALLCRYGLGGCWSRVPCVTAPCCPLSSCPCCCWCGGWTQAQVAFLALAATFPVPSRNTLAPGCKGGPLTASSEEESEGRGRRTGLRFPLSTLMALCLPVRSSGFAGSERPGSGREGSAGSRLRDTQRDRRARAGAAGSLGGQAGADACPLSPQLSATRRPTWRWCSRGGCARTTCTCSCCPEQRGSGGGGDREHLQVALERGKESAPCCCTCRPLDATYTCSCVATCASCPQASRWRRRVSRGAADTLPSCASTLDESWATRVPSSPSATAAPPAAWYCPRPLWVCPA